LIVLQDVAWRETSKVNLPPARSKAVAYPPGRLWLLQQSYREAVAGQVGRRGQSPYAAPYDHDRVVSFGLICGCQEFQRFPVESCSGRSQGRQIQKSAAGNEFIQPIFHNA